MRRQGLRSATSGNDPCAEDLDRTLTEIPENRELTSNMEPRGQTINRNQGGEELPESLTKKFEYLVKRVRKILEVATEITQALEERSNRIETQFNRLEAQQTRIMDRMNAEEGRRGEDPRIIERISSIKYILPEFQGNTSPIRYMNQLKQYGEAVKPRDNDTLYLIEKSLSGPPGDC